MTYSSLDTQSTVVLVDSYTFLLLATEQLELGVVSIMSDLSW